MKRVFATLARAGTLAPLALAYALAASAAPAELANAADPAASVAQPDAPAALDGYRPYRDGGMPSWQQLNADAARENRLGGMGTMHGIGAMSAGKHATAASAASASPEPAHKGHHPGGRP